MQVPSTKSLAHSDQNFNWAVVIYIANALGAIKRIPHLVPFNVLTGAIIGDGDRKSWDARGPMIWDNFSIFRTNCAIVTSYIRANPRTCHGFSRGCCHVA